ncbi:MAG: hypothetical protein KKB37_12795 [Alphaproteobacteria bacterium]|nr:hypothetical protein [Alphaproteobacteria bacterium]
MSEHRHQKPIPRAALLGGAALIGFSLTLAVVGRQTGIGTTSTPKSEAVVTRDLRFSDGADGSVIVRLAPSDRTIAVLPPGTSGFVRVVVRGLARHRKHVGLGAQEPFRLTYWADHRLSIDDPMTGHQVQLGGFGRPNRQAFANLLIAGGTTQ